MTIESLRKKIDKIDNKILEQLTKRAKIAQEIGKIKKQKKLEFFSPAREKQIIEHLTKKNKSPLSSLAIKNIFGEILSACRSLEAPIKVAYLGPQGTFTHLATIERFGSSVETYPKDSIADVFFDVEKDISNYGVVPVENSTEGVVNCTLDMFINSDLLICAEIYLKISHHLLGRCKINQIKRIYSNPQAISQCKIWIKNNIGKNVEIVETSSTTKATEKVLKEKYSASIASDLSSKIYNIPIIAENIQDNPLNKTRFLVIGKSLSEKSGKDKTSLMFSVPHKAGALYKALGVLSRYKINMTMIESRPAGQRPWDYVFFIDVQGHYKDKCLSSAIEEMKNVCSFVKILGSYPEAE